MDSIASGIEDADWRGPWILVIFKNANFKSRFLKSKIEIVFQDNITFDGNVSELALGDQNDPEKVMLDILGPFIDDIDDIVLKPVKFSIYENLIKNEIPMNLTCSHVIN